MKTKDEFGFVEAKQALGKRIEAAMKGAGLSVAKLAEALGLNHTTKVYKWINGEDCCPPHEIYRIADITGKPRGWFYDEQWGTDVAQAVHEEVAFLIHEVIEGKQPSEAVERHAGPGLLSPAIKQEMDGQAALLREEWRRRFEEKAGSEWEKIPPTMKWDILRLIADEMIAYRQAAARIEQERNGGSNGQLKGNRARSK